MKPGEESSLVPTDGKECRKESSNWNQTEIQRRRKKISFSVDNNSLTLIVSKEKHNVNDIKRPVILHCNEEMMCCLPKASHNIWMMMKLINSCHVMTTHRQWMGNNCGYSKRDALAGAKLIFCGYLRSTWYSNPFGLSTKGNGGRGGGKLLYSIGLHRKSISGLSQCKNIVTPIEITPKRVRL